MAETSEGERVSKSTLYTTWNSQWKKYMPFRNIGQGKRCRVCAQLDEARANATTRVEKHELVKEKMVHISEIKADRSINVRGNTQSTYDASHPSPDGSGKVLQVIVDGMDQSKFRTPRNIVPRGSNHAAAGARRAVSVGECVCLLA